MTMIINKIDPHIPYFGVGGGGWCGWKVVDIVLCPEKVQLHPAGGDSRQCFSDSFFDVLLKSGC